MRLIDYYGRELVFDGFQYRSRVTPLRLSLLSILRRSIACFNTAIGYHPMRLELENNPNVERTKFQYRNRVSPHAARLWQCCPLSSGGFNTAIGYHPMRLIVIIITIINIAKFQYRNRVSPHAA